MTNSWWIDSVTYDHYIKNYSKRRENHWKNFLIDIEMPKDFADSSYKNDVFPSISADATKDGIDQIQIFFVDIDGWVGENSWDINDMCKYIIGSIDNDFNWSLLGISDDWDEILKIIKEVQQ